MHFLSCREFCAPLRGGGILAPSRFFSTMRPGRRPKAPKAASAPEPSQAEVMAALLMSAPPERQQQLIDSIWDRACGQRVWVGEQRKAGAKELGVKTRRVRMEDLDTGEAIEGWVYELPGDPASQKLLVEHGIGRPPVRETAKADPVIQLIHRVPGKRDWRTPVQEQQQQPDDMEGRCAPSSVEGQDPQGEASATGEAAPGEGAEPSPEVPGVLMFGGKPYGLGAVFPPEPEDEP